VGGKVTTSFGAGTFVGAFGVAIQPNGKIVTAGEFSGGVSSDFALARYNTDGSLDSSFGTNGKVITDFGAGSDDYAYAVAIQPSGKIVVAGVSNVSGSDDFALARYNADGSLDGSFGTAGKVITGFGGFRDQAFAVAIQPNGKIVAAGKSNVASNSDFALARYNADGTLDSSFGTGGQVRTGSGISTAAGGAGAVAIQSDGKIAAAGFGFFLVSGSYDLALARYNADGSLDSSFGTGGKVTTDFGASDDYASAIAIQSNGKIVAGGVSVATATGNSDFALACYSVDGSLDSSFGTGGKVITGFGAGTLDGANAVAIQPNGQIVAAGISRTSGTNDFALARYLSR
jgi:uncharacterized delta-60 repeat protein